ncbi:hypothetical protein MLD38_018228 [Melastoma candidum]|uniref:Uncharacterized protein n=1 Tax=Melastoma candidum TaxID=119954 RepID=A0ACB9QT49_9MYRT|nr:hypothetical protein MLD38_018228 [Melastoma candidum]
MAAAEARAVWQRAVNRCFVQEDAKRAPKLACCQSNSTSKPVNSEQPPGGSDGGDYPSSVFMPFSQRPPFTAPPNTRWWLLQEPSHDFPRCLTSQQLRALDPELEGTKDTVGDPCRKSSDMSMQTDEVSAVNSVSGDFKSNEVMENMELTESYEMVEICQTGSCATSSKTNVDAPDLDGPWIGNGRNVPWWRTTDGSELASFVATKSSDHLENCDLPPPQRVQIRKRPSPSYGPFEHPEALRSSLDWKAHRLKTFGNSWGTVETPTSSEREETIGEQLTADGDSPSRHGLAFAKTQRVHGVGAEGSGDLDTDKAQLLEALCHSQTRAREAEMAAKQAREEKEHVIRLFFRQASQLFAYKQWFQLLNLEAARQNKTNGKKGVPTLVPVLLPWVPCRGKRVRKRSSKGPRSGQGRRKQAKHGFTEYAVVFAVGLGLVGAGLLLGWTVGWMLPLF